MALPSSQPWPFVIAYGLPLRVESQRVGLLTIPTHCPPKFSPRDLSIADDGAITARPGTVDTEAR